MANSDDEKLFNEFIAFKEFKEHQKRSNATKSPNKSKKGKYKKRNDGRYYATITVGKNIENGNPIRVPIYAKTETELENKKALIKADFLRGNSLMLKKIIFEEYANKWLNSKKKHISYKTWEMYESVVRIYIDTIRYKSMRDITRMDIQEIIDAQIKKPRTCKKIAVTLKQIFEASILDDVIYKNPVKGVLLPEYRPKPKRPLTDVENTISETADFTDREKAYILLIKWCGLRKEEVLALEISKFDFHNNTVRIDQAVSFIKNRPNIKGTKSEAGKRTMPLVPTLIPFLKYYISNLDGKWLFTSLRSNELISEQSFKKLWNSIIKKMKSKSNELGYKEEIIGLTSHIFRHNFATLLFQSGVPIKEAQYLLGHSSINVTMDIYTHVDHSKLKATSILGAVATVNAQSISNEMSEKAFK